MGSIGELFWLLVSAVLCFLPTIIAFKRNLPNKIKIFLINLFLGWTIVGWFVALSMASVGKYRRVVDICSWLAIFALLAAIAMPGMLSAKRAAGFKKAKENLQSISSALEGYAKNHGGQYPPNIETLKSDQPQAFTDVCGKSGTLEDFYYTYECYFTPQGYMLLTNVKPDAPRARDWRKVSIETGGVVKEN